MRSKRKRKSKRDSSAAGSRREKRESSSRREKRDGSERREKKEKKSKKSKKDTIIKYEDNSDDESEYSELASVRQSS